MTTYHPMHMTLTREQGMKLLKGDGISISHANLTGGPHTIHVTATDKKRLHDAHKAGKGARLSLSASAVKHNISGRGFLGDLFGSIGRFLLPVASTALGVATGSPVVAGIANAAGNAILKKFGHGVGPYAAHGGSFAGGSFRGGSFVGAGTRKRR